MKSGKCLFSKTIFRSDILRFLPFAVLLLIEQAVNFPVVIFSNYHNDAYSYQAMGLDDFVSISAVSGGFVFVFAAVMALLVFSYLFSPNKCNALHAFPIGRKALYLTHLCSGYLLLVVPQLLAFGAAIPVICTVSKEAGTIIALQITAIFGESLVYYVLAVIAVMLAANLFAGAVIYLILNFAYTAFTTILNAAVSIFGFGIEGLTYHFGAGKYLSPLTSLMSDKMAVSYRWRDDYFLQPEGIGQSYYVTVLELVIAAAVLAVLAYLLYKARALECAGDMVAFKAEIPVFSVLVSVIGGALLAAFIALMIDAGNIGMTVLYVVFSLLLFFAVQMILKKSARVFQLKQFALWFAACALSLALVFGLGSFETNYVPNVKSVESVTVYVSYDVTLTDPAEIEKAEEMHRLLLDRHNEESTADEDYIAAYEESGAGYFDEDYVYEGDNCSYVSVSYVLKNGATMNRHYYVYNDDEAFWTMLDGLEAAHQPQTVFDRLEGIDFVIKSVEFDNYANDNYRERYLNTDEFETAYQLCAAEAAEMAADYRTSNNSGDKLDYDYRICFECVAKTDADMDKLVNLAVDSDVNGTSYYMDIVDNTFFIDVSTFPENSQALAYVTGDAAE